MATPRDGDTAITRTLPFPLAQPLDYPTTIRAAALRPPVLFGLSYHAVAPLPCDPPALCRCCLRTLLPHSVPCCRAASPQVIHCLHPGGHTSPDWAPAAHWAFMRTRYDAAVAAVAAERTPPPTAVAQVGYPLDFGSHSNHTGVVVAAAEVWVQMAMAAAVAAAVANCLWCVYARWGRLLLASGESKVAMHLRCDQRRQRPNGAAVPRSAHAC